MALKVRAIKISDEMWERWQARARASDGKNSVASLIIASMESAGANDTELAELEVARGVDHDQVQELEAALSVARDDAELLRVANAAQAKKIAQLTRDMELVRAARASASGGLSASALATVVRGGMVVRNSPIGPVLASAVPNIPGQATPRFKSSAKVKE